MIAGLLKLILPESVRAVLLAVGVVAYLVAQVTSGTVKVICETIAALTGASALFGTTVAAVKVAQARKAEVKEPEPPPVVVPQPGSDQGIGSTPGYDPTKMP